MRFHSKSGSEQLSELYTSHTIHVWPFRNQHVQVPCRVPRQGHYTNQRPFFQKRAKVSVIWKIKVIASTAIKSSVKKNGWRMDTFPPSPKTIPFRILRAINRHQKARTQLLRSNGTTHPFNVKLYLPHSRSSHIITYIGVIYCIPIKNPNKRRTVIFHLTSTSRGGYNWSHPTKNTPFWVVDRPSCRKNQVPLVTSKPTPPGAPDTWWRSTSLAPRGFRTIRKPIENPPFGCRLKPWKIPK